MKTSVLLLCILSIALTICVNGQQPTAKNGSLFPVVKNGKFGYINARGTIVIPLQFEYAYDFSEGLAVVRIAGGVSFIDSKGTILLTPQPGKLLAFYEGMALICRQMSGSERCGYLDRNGKVAVELIYDSPKTDSPHFWRFSEGVAPVMKDGKGGYIDRSGEYVIAPQFDQVFFFSEGLAEVGTGGKFGFIDRTGKYVVNPIYMHLYYFSDGLAVASLDRRKAGYIDNQGRWVIEPKFDRGFIENFFEGRALVYSNQKVGYIDKKGKFVIPAKYDNTSGLFDFTGRFSEGLAVVNVGGKRGYINKLGKIVIRPAFDYGEDFSNGLARVHVGNRQGYINKTGKYVWQPSN